MAIGKSATSLDNLFRLQGLKNVSGRRKVLPGAETVEDMEAPPPEMSGTGQDLPNFANFIPPMEEAGMEDQVAPETYDVRANNIVYPTKREPIDLIQLGKSLGNMVQSENPQQMAQENIQSQLPSPQEPPIETAQVDLQEGLPPVTESQEVNASMNPPQTQIPPVNEIPQQEQQQQKEPGTYVEVGAAQSLYDNPETPPELKSEIERIFDTKVTPERMKEISEFENAVQGYVDRLNGFESALNTREKELMEKVANKDLSTSEQISMAMALLAPAIIAGLIAGKGGFAGGLAEGGKNVLNMLSSREKGLNEAQELLPEIALEKSKVGKEQLAVQKEAAEMKRKINENVPNRKLRDLFDRDGMLVNGKLVLNTGNPLLPLKSSAVRTAKDYDTFREKTMPRLADKIAVTDQGLDVLHNLDALLDATEAGEKGIARDYIPFYDVAARTMKAYMPVARDRFVDEEGNEVKIEQLFDTYAAQGYDLYNQANTKGSGGSAFQAKREQFKEMIGNPFTKEAWKEGRSEYGTTRSQINALKHKFETGLYNDLDANGIETSPVKELFSQNKLNTKKSEKTRKQNRANEAVKQTLGK